VPARQPITAWSVITGADEPIESTSAGDLLLVVAAEALAESRLSAFAARGAAAIVLRASSAEPDPRELRASSAAPAPRVLRAGSAEPDPRVLRASSTEPDPRGDPSEPAGIDPALQRCATVAARFGLGVYWLEPPGTWNELHHWLFERLPGGTGGGALAGSPALDDLAQTIAGLTGGLVTIEDPAARVLAYSRSSDEVDDLRRMSILGRRGPPQYLALLEQWGVYRRLAQPETVVDVAEHPESGVRRRLAVGVFAGRTQLATIWVQRGRQEFGPHAERAMLGAARVTAAQLAQRDTPAAPPPADLRHLLGGDARGLRLLGRDATRPCVMAVLTFGAPASDRASDVLRTAALRAHTAVQAAALHRNALVEQIDGRICLLLPAVVGPASALSQIETIVASARTLVDGSVRAGVGAVVGSAESAGESLRTADVAAAQSGGAVVASFDQLRNRLTCRAAVDLVAGRTDLADPDLARLTSSHPELAITLMRFLDTGGDVSRVATELDIHVSTVRYRLRRAAELAGLDLSDSDSRLAALLRLRATCLNPSPDPLLPR
jgi:DNA-binding PucR family transcriptional regulator